MFTKESILKEMRAGASIEDIAAEMTAILNEANAEYERQTAASAKRARKEEIARKFNDLVKEYAELECPGATKWMEEAQAEEDMDVLVATLDEMFASLRYAMTMADNIQKFADATPSDRTYDKCADLSDDDIIASFLSKICQ
jgi:hypothetical protein